MDEIDWLKTTKKALILFTKVFIGFAVLFAIMALLSGEKNGWRDTEILLFGALIIGVGLPVIMGVCYLVINLFLKILNSGRTVINFNKEHISDLPNHCSPAICSLIYDLKIDVYKDYTATILYLCIRKYINLIKNGDTYRVELAKKQDYSNLGRCEKYVLNIIENKIKFDENKFKKEIIKEAQERELITNKKHSKKIKIALILILVVIFLIITYNIHSMVFMLSISFVCSIFLAIGFITLMKVEGQITLDIVDTEYIRTEDGKNIALLLKGLKKYIKEYTLIKEKEINHIQVLENYIPYALALDEADAVEEFIKYNDEYRDLIYNRKDMQ